MTSNIIIPFIGYGDFKLYQSLSDTKGIIKECGLKYTTEIWPNNDFTNPVPWTILRIEGQISLFFANDKLFKIYIENGCNARLPNGICLGMPIEEAMEIDSKLEWNDWDEDFQSSEGSFGVSNFPCVQRANIKHLFQSSSVGYLKISILYSSISSPRF